MSAAAISVLLSSHSPSRHTCWCSLQLGFSEDAKFFYCPFSSPPPFVNLHTKGLVCRHYLKGTGLSAASAINAFSVAAITLGLC
jgi:hypothetical protein